MGIDAESSERERPPRQVGRPYPKGVSGNPGGRPKMSIEVRDLARESTVDNIAALVKIVTPRDAKGNKLDVNPNPPAAIVAAANVLLDRGWGKAPQMIEATVDFFDRLPTPEQSALQSVVDMVSRRLADLGITAEQALAIGTARIEQRADEATDRGREGEEAVQPLPGHGTTET